MTKGIMKGNGHTPIPCYTCKNDNTCDYLHKDSYNAINCDEYVENDKCYYCGSIVNKYEGGIVLDDNGEEQTYCDDCLPQVIDDI